MLGEPGPFSEITAVIDSSHVQEEEEWAGGAHHTEETVDMARLAEPPACPSLTSSPSLSPPLGVYPPTVSGSTDLSVRTQHGHLSGMTAEQRVFKVSVC